MNEKHGKNRSITPGSNSIEKNQRTRNERSRTPTELNDKTKNNEGMKLFKMNYNNKDAKVIADNIANMANCKVNGPVFHDSPANVSFINDSTQQEPSMPMKVPPNTMRHIPLAQQQTQINGNIKPYDFYLKR